MTIHLYSICWNEMKMLGFFFRHYEPWIDRFVVFDDGSNDGTLDFLQSSPKVDVRRFIPRNPDTLEFSTKLLKDECWKESRGKADWVVVVDIDEHIFHPKLDEYLTACRRDGVTLIPALGFNMVTETFPRSDENLARTHTLGAPTHRFSKLCVFDPNAIDETNYGVGAHSAQVRGRLVYPHHDELLLLHYKHVGLDYVIERHRLLAGRRRPVDLMNRWGRHYFGTREEIEQMMAELRKNLVDVTDPAYQPWRDHREKRWWRKDGDQAAQP